MKRSILFLLTTIIALLYMVGCCDCRKRSKLEKQLVGTEWQLVQIMAKDIVAEGDSYTLTFMNNGTVAGKGDCNMISATYTTTASRELRITNLGSTRQLCRNFELENQYMDMLEAITHYEMDADHMLLLKNGTLVGIMKAKSEMTNKM